MGNEAGERLREEYLDAIEYEDTGCEISEKCVECPLPKCKHDDANWYRQYRRYAHQYPMLVMLQQPFVNYASLSKKFKIRAVTVKLIHKKVLNEEIDFDVVKILYNKLIQPQFPKHLKKKK